MYRSIVALLASITIVNAQAPAYGQCGGIGWSGAKTCISGYRCQISNEYYSQCLPGTETTTSRATTPSSSPSPGSLGSFVLTGDSTVTDNAGWGGAFCAQVLNNGVACTNYAVGGTTTASFRARGEWAKALTTARSAKKPVYVLIQFGHNDMKVMDLKTYQANLQGLGRDVQAIAGAIPIFVTSLSRRTYSGGAILDSLPAWASTMIAAANAIRAPYVDLNTNSITYLNKIGSTAAHKMDYASGDSTHLNACGGRVFARMVADLIKAKNICVPNPFKLDATTTSNIARGVAQC